MQWSSQYFLQLIQAFLSPPPLLQVRSFKGKPLIDIRELYMGPKGPAPGKKGISLSVTEWRELCDLMGDIDEEIQKIT